MALRLLFIIDRTFVIELKSKHVFNGFNSILNSCLFTINHKCLWGMPHLISDTSKPGFPSPQIISVSYSIWIQFQILSKLKAYLGLRRTKI